MEEFDLIECISGYSSGSPKLVGRRLTMNNVVVGLGSYSANVIEYLDEFEISKEEALQSLKYCKTLQCNIDNPDNYCDGCILRSINENNSYNVNNNDASQEFIKINESYYFLGSGQELIDDQFGIPTWLLAEELYESLKEFLNC